MRKFIVVFLCALVLFSCDSKPSLQKYFVEKTESSKFIAVDLSPNIIKTNKVNLSETEKAALESFDKMNVIAFKSDSTDVTGYETEITEVKTILKEETYQQLIKFGSGNDGAAIYFVGNDDEHIEEFVVLAQKKENGFAVIRVLGNDMNPNHVLNMLRLLQKSNLDLEQLQPLQQLMK
jgi:hypothetical protein